MATVTVTPETFTLVQFDPSRLAAVASKVADDLGFGGSPIEVRVDETTPLGRSRIESQDPIVLAVESGSIEDPRHPRQLSDLAVAETVGRNLLKLRDRRDAVFAAPDADESLDLAHKVAWEIYAVARLARLGYRDQRQRWLYHFRNRCGFSDATDAAFDVLWSADHLTWPEIVGLVDGALAERRPAA